MVAQTSQARTHPLRCYELPMLQGPNCAAIAMAGEPSDDEGDDLEGDLEDGTGDDAGLDTGVETGVETDAAGFREPWP